MAIDLSVIWSRPADWTTEDEAALAQKTMPVEWERAGRLRRPGRQRKAVRKRAVSLKRYESLVTAGASCASCKYRQSAPFGASCAWVCALGAESGGVYQPTTMEGLCALWELRTDCLNLAGPMGESLKPCPKCQSADDLTMVQVCSGGGFGVMCRSCHLTFDCRSESEEYAKILWNDQVPNPRIAKLEGLLREAQVNLKAATRNVDLLNRIASALEASRDH